MKRWPLRWKLALYAAALAVVATIAGAATTWAIMRYWELKSFDQRLALDAQELFRDVENFEGGGAANSGAFQEKFVPLALKDRLIEIRRKNGDLIYQSPNISGSGLQDGVEEIHTRKIGGRGIRMGTFHWNDLTLSVGADTREINRIGWD